MKDKVIRPNLELPDAFASFVVMNKDMTPEEYTAAINAWKAAEMYIFRGVLPSAEPALLRSNKKQKKESKQEPVLQSKEVRMTLSDFQVLRNVLRESLQSREMMIKDFTVWAKAAYKHCDKDRKDDPEVKLWFDELNADRNAIRKAKKEIKRLSAIQANLRRVLAMGV